MVYIRTLMQMTLKINMEQNPTLYLYKLPRMVVKTAGRLLFAQTLGKSALDLEL